MQHNKQVIIHLDGSGMIRVEGPAVIQITNIVHEWPRYKGLCKDCRRELNRRGSWCCGCSRWRGVTESSWCYVCSDGRSVSEGYSFSKATGHGTSDSNGSRG